MGEPVGHRGEEASKEGSRWSHAIKSAAIKDELTLPGNQGSVLFEPALQIRDDGMSCPSGTQVFLPGVLYSYRSLGLFR